MFSPSPIPSLSILDLLSMLCQCDPISHRRDARGWGDAGLAGRFPRGPDVRKALRRTSHPPPEPLDAAVLFAPNGGLVPVALRALDRGGTLAVAGIYLSDIPALNYERELFQERTLRSVTSNTREDGRALLAVAASHRLRVTVTPYQMARADEALADLAAGRVTGAAVLTP
jgi:D-arabinose 1-dehydrogenase-like Zn-dependent alcohol dehydrogenase